MVPLVGMIEMRTYEEGRTGLFKSQDIISYKAHVDFMPPIYKALHIQWLLPMTHLISINYTFI